MSTAAEVTRKAGARGWIVAAGILLLAALAYRGVAVNGFVNFDDQVFLTANPVVQKGLTAGGAVWAFTTTSAVSWQPLSLLSHMLDVQLFGLDPGRHHLVSLAIHAGNALLLFLLLRKLTGALWRPALVTALFAVHPLHVESVAWAAERSIVLSTFLLLVAAHAYQRAARSGSVLGSFALPLLFALSLMAKPLPVTFPFLMLLVDWWPLGRWAPGRPLPRSAPRPDPGLWPARHLPPARLWLEKAPLFFLAAVFSAIAFFTQRREGAMAFGAVLSAARRAENMLLAYATYLRKTGWPVDLAVFYPYPARESAWWVWGGALALLAGVTLLALLSARRRPYLAVGWLWFLGALVPVIGVVQVGMQALADRFTYLPLTGIFVAAAWAVGDGVSSRPRLQGFSAAACCAALLVLAGLTRSQVSRWRDSLTLHRHAIAVTRDNWKAWNLLGNAFVERGELEQAVSAYRTALGIAGDEAVESASMRFNLAAALHRQGRSREAAGEYRAALRYNPGDTEAMNNLGNILLATGDRAEALGLFRRALALAPRLSPAHFNLAAALAAQGDLDGAERHLREVLDIDPKDAGALALLAEVLSGTLGASGTSAARVVGPGPR